MKNENLKKSGILLQKTAINILIILGLFLLELFCNWTLSDDYHEYSDQIETMVIVFKWASVALKIILGLVVVSNIYRIGDILVQASEEKINDSN